ncbi:hypothetical protein HIM_08810 [Hirsutella minnesotensis 3608]|uniref:Uncharacterized protein n=1 Tax=Hirsutella minnesotensis 3608 TaxID=1043627 RepID=A0A0F7ZM80_9HYPO|nr:hypothetical protein HIM_08810 [Hirsutella minnesotensis 3608]
MSSNRDCRNRQPLSRRPQASHRLLSVCAVGLLAAVAVRGNQPLQLESFGRLHPSEASSWDGWKSLEPSRSLRWTKCYNDAFECARLQVPIDWHDPSNKETVNLGVIKLPARSRSTPLPPVFVNPGGPGGSGVDYMKKAGHAMQTIVGDNQDLISWDPRGVGVSTPRVECWGNGLKRQLWDLQEPGIVDEREGLVYDVYSRSIVWAKACEATLNETTLLQHLSTPHHARDMLEILEKTGHRKLRYWGVSYGTALGGVFAGLFPDRVERLVSDGNVDYREYFGQGLRSFLKDADGIIEAFDSLCHSAGPRACVLWASSPEAVQERRENLLEKLKKQPVLVPAWSHKKKGPDMPQRVTYSRLQRMTRIMAYVPVFSFPLMAQIYAALEADDGPRFYELVSAAQDQVKSTGSMCLLGDMPATEPRETIMEPDGFPAVMCSDSRGLRSLDEFEEFVRHLRGSSRWLGAVHADFGKGCAGRLREAKWRFSADDIKTDTAFPILFIGNHMDNVTPLESTYNNSARFPSSAVLEQKSFGHASSAAPSTCTAKYIRAYFQNGTLPTSGTQCEQDMGLFEQPRPRDSLPGLEQGLDGELARATYEFSYKMAMEMLQALAM